MTAHVTDRLSAYLDRELSVAETATVREHLATCEACAERLGYLAAVDRQVRDLPTEAPPRYFDSFATRVRARIDTSSRPRAGFRIPVWTWAVAAAVLVAVILPRMPKAMGPDAAPAKEARDAAPAAATLARPEQRGAASATPAAETNRLRPLGYVEPQAEGQLKPQAPSFAVPPPAAAPTTTVPPTTVPPTTVPPTTVPPTTVPPTTVPPTTVPPTTVPPTTVPPPLAPPPARARAQVEQASAAELAKKTDGFAAGKPADTRQESLAAAADASVADEVSAQKTGAPAGALEKDKRQDGGARVAKGEEAMPPTGGSSEAKLLRRAPIGAAPAAPSAATEYRVLDAQGTGTPLAVRRDGWRDFASRHPEDPRADEARVRVVALGVDLALETGAETDRSRARQDALDYLARKDASQKGRVRVLLDRLAP